MALVVLTSLAALAADLPSTMQFSGITAPSDWQLLFDLPNIWKIFADGPIDDGASARLEQYIQAHRVPNQSIIFLNSPGGSLLGGLQLGRVLRRHNFSTYIGRSDGDPKFTPPPLGNGFSKELPGECFSACALAFLGGKFRYIDAKSAYGVHRFSFLIEQPTNADTAQILSASIAQYLQEMGIDSLFFTIMTRAAPSDISILSRQELEKLNVINNGRDKAVWSVESLPTGIYLKGQQDTVYGLDKYMITCDPHGNIFLFINFDAQGRGKQLIDDFKADSIVIDGNFIPIGGQEIYGPVLKNGFINVFYNLTGQLLSKIEQAKTVGYAMQRTYDAPGFFGFAYMDFSAGAKKLPGFLKVCRKS
jgi:hypothetical protein